jgi:hypothetical protein
VLPPAAQAAESFVRDLVGETSLTALTTEAAEAAEELEVMVRHEDGRTWTVLVRRVGAGVDLVESCGKRAIAAQEWLLRLA